MTDQNTRPQPSAEPVINAVFETSEGGVTGTTDARVKRVERQDDGSYTVVIDHWPQPSAEPVAYLKEWNVDGPDCKRVDLWPDLEPWLQDINPVVTPLYPASALEAARREGWEAMRQAACDLVGLVMTEADINGRDEVSDDLYGIQCRLSVLEPSALKENPNAG